MLTSELEKLADAMYSVHELLGRAESGKDSAAITKSLGAFSLGAKQDRSKLDESMKKVIDNLPSEERYVAAIQTLKKYSDMNSVKCLIDELYETFPDSGLDKL